MQMKYHGKLLAEMERNDFLEAVERSAEELTEATARRATLVLWASRLRPYLDADPHVTVAEAINRFEADESAKSVS